MAAGRLEEGVPHPEDYSPRLPNTLPPYLVEDADGGSPRELSSTTPKAGFRGHLDAHRLHARTLVDEVAAFRSEFAEHHSKLLTLVTQRLEAISAHAEVPEALWVALPNGPSTCEGLYRLVRDRRPNGLPLWRKEDGNHWIYSMTSERWGIGGQKEHDEDFSGDGAYVFCPDPHFGQMPNQLQAAWKRNNPAWTSDHSISIRALPHAKVGAAKSNECLTRMHAKGNEQFFSIPTDRVSVISLPAAVPPQRDRPSGSAAAVRQILQTEVQEISTAAPTHHESVTSAFQSVQSHGSRMVTKLKSTIVSRRTRAPVFADVDRMKAELLKGVRDGEYSVEKFYKTEGWCQAIARHALFEYFTLLVIGINACWIGYDVDCNTANALPRAPMSFQVMENLFCSYFTVEMLIRFGAFKETKNAFSDPQFIFDLALLSLMIFETWFVYLLLVLEGGTPDFMAGAGALSLLRMLRLSRMCRLVRILRAVPELMVLIKGLAAASRSVAWTMCLMVVIIYAFSVAFKILTNNSRVGGKYFDSVPAGMVTLMLPGLLPDNAEYAYDMASDNTVAAVIFMGFILVAAVTLMNLLIGVLVEGVSTVADVEKESLNISYAKAELLQLFKAIDKDNNSLLSRAELESVLLNPQCGKAFHRLNVDVQGLVDIASLQLFREKENISFPEFLELVLELRGANQVKVRDVVNLRKIMVEELWHMEDRLMTSLAGSSCALGSGGLNGGLSSGDLSSATLGNASSSRRALEVPGRSHSSAWR